MEFVKSKDLLHSSQIGFIPGNRTADHIFTLKTLHEKYINQNRNEKIYACFVHFKKAFDSVWHEGLYLKLIENGIGGRFYDLIKALYSNSKCAIKVSDNATPFFSYSRGVRQGCVLSPLLFNLFINELPKLFEKANTAPFLLPNGTRLSSLLYADDLVILSRSKSGLQSCLNVLNEWSNKWLMNVNLKKTKVMILQKHNSKLKKIDFFLGDKRIDITNEYTYLGLKFTQNTKFNVATEQLSEKATHALFKIRKQLNFHNLNPKLAMKIFDGIISPILLYNSEIWGAYAKNDYHKWDKTTTEKTHLKFCKLYLGTNRKASNIASRGELGKFPLLIQILKRLFMYIHHIANLPDSSIAKQSFYLSKRLYLNGYESFYSNIVNIIKKIFPEINDEPLDIVKFVEDTDINDFIKIAKDNYISFWKQEIEKSTKLSFYATFKKDYNLENYLHTIKDPNQRRIFTKFRISNHKLEIEYGRYKNINRTERFCKNCNNAEVEDEFHFAFECKKYEDMRKNSHNILKEYFQSNITNELKRKLLSNVMSCEDPVLTQLFSKHLLTCFTIRDKST